MNNAMTINIPKEIVDTYERMLYFCKTSGGSIRICKKWLNNREEFYIWALSKYKPGDFLFLIPRGKIRCFHEHGCYWAKSAQDGKISNLTDKVIFEETETVRKDKKEIVNWSAFFEDKDSKFYLALFTGRYIKLSQFCNLIKKKNLLSEIQKFQNRSEKSVRTLARRAIAKRCKNNKF